jgi:ABC-type ATPase with predicted acetyltransferase domain
VALYLALLVGRYLISGADFMLVVGLLGLVGLGLLLSVLIWRCPACERYLGEELYPVRCPKCGVALADGRIEEAESEATDDEIA